VKTPIVKVIFRVRDGEVCALFPEIPVTCNIYACQCYTIGTGHGTASVGFMYVSKPATPIEYRDLAGELARIGYKIKIGKRFTRADMRSRQIGINGELKDEEEGE